MDAMDYWRSGQWEGLAVIQPVGDVNRRLATAIFKNMNADCECIVTPSNFSFKAVCKEQPLNHVDKLLATIATSMFGLCF